MWYNEYENDAGHRKKSISRTVKKQSQGKKNDYKDGCRKESGGIGRNRFQCDEQ